MALFAFCTKWLCIVSFITVHLFVGLVHYVFSLPELKKNKIALLSCHLCQEPLENFFGCQRQRGGTNDNPNALEFSQNTQALRVVDSFCWEPVIGNCRGTRVHVSTVVAKIKCVPFVKHQHKRLHTHWIK